MVTLGVTLSVTKAVQKAKLGPGLDQYREYRETDATRANPGADRVLALVWR